MAAMNLFLRARTHFLSPPPPLSFSTHRCLSPLVQRFKPFSSSSSASPIKMSSQIVEHFVLFKVKPDTEPSKIDSMINGLTALNSLDAVVYLTAGQILRNRSTSFSFTHMLHSRYKSKEDLGIYADHPSHVSVVTDSVRPICEDIMAVDWIADDLAGPIVPPAGSAMRVTFLKLKEGLGDEEKKEVLGVIGGIKEAFPAITQLTSGENFCARAKGFSIGSIAILPSVSELEGLDSNPELVSLQKEKVRDLLESVIVLDYEIPQHQSSSL